MSNIELNEICEDYKRLAEDVRILKGMFNALEQYIGESVSYNKLFCLSAYSELLNRVVSDMQNSDTMKRLEDGRL